MSRYRCAIPAGAEDSDDSDDDLWMRNPVRSEPAQTEPTQPLEPSSQTQMDPYSDICTLPNRNQRSVLGGTLASSVPEKRNKESVVEEFRMALAADRVDAAKSMLNHLDPNVVSRSGWSPLMYAVESGHLEICKQLLEMGANAQHHIDNFSVLMSACKCRQFDGSAGKLIKILVEEHGVPTMEAKDRYHSTPLMYAAMEGHADVVKYLIDICKVPVDSYDARGHTALMLSVRRGQLEVSRLLLERGADREKMNVDGKTAKDLSMDSGNVAIINLLNDKAHHLVSALDSFNEVSRFGEMESFFHGLQLHELIDTFREQKVEFKQLLLLTEADLIQLGVKMGDVKKISEAIHAIHKQPWNKTSLHKFDQKTRNVLKCSEAVALVSNIGKHASLMCSCIGYAADQVKSHPIVIESGIDNGAAVELRCATREALANCRALERELLMLDGQVNEKETVKDTLPVDEISKERPRRKRSKGKWMRLFVICSLGGGVMAYGMRRVLLS